MIPIAPTEAEVLKAVMRTFAALGVRVERQNTGVGQYVDRHGRKRWVRFGEAGRLDLVGDLDGRYLEVEVKRPPRRVAGRLIRSLPTEKQYQRMIDLNAKGAIAFWVDSAVPIPKVVDAIREGYRVLIDGSGDVVLVARPIDPVEVWRPRAPRPRCPR